MFLKTQHWHSPLKFFLWAFLMISASLVVNINDQQSVLQTGLMMMFDNLTERLTVSHVDSRNSIDRMVRFRFIMA